VWLRAVEDSGELLFEGIVIVDQDPENPSCRSMNVDDALGVDAKDGKRLA
jgi:hypothetical protein